MTAVVEATGKLDAERPWPGLVAFPEEASHFFYGRDLECNEVFRRIRREMATLLFGQSGLGKTSLLQAGLFPLLRRNSFLPVPIRLDYTTTAISPATQIVVTLQQALADAQLSKCSPVRQHERLWEYFHQTDLQLVSVGGDLVIPVFVFDQFEEAFTLGLAREGMRGKTQEFLIELTDLIENRPSDDLEIQFESSPGLVENYVFDRQPYRIVVSLREDYLASLESMRERAPSLGRSRFRLTHMNGRQALDAVTKPGRDIISADVASEIIRFISQPRREDPFGVASTEGAIDTLEVEPSLLSLFCHELNERRLQTGARRITHELVSGSSRSVLEEFYERTLADQPPALRTFVEEELITQSGFRESVALERALESLRQRGIAPEALDTLVQRRLLRVEERLQVSRIELIHDLLIAVVQRSRANREQRYVAAALPAETWVGKSPFRGLESYRFEDAPIFFGRAEATQSAFERLLKNAETGHPFLLILGADGVGKSSLVQAGLVPSLIMRDSVFGSSLWWRAVMQPGAHGGGPIAVLAEAIARANGLLEQSEASGLVSQMRDSIISDPGAPVIAALQAREAAERRSGKLPAYGVARLVVVVDQLEEIFFTTISHAERSQFINCLQRFVDCGRIFVIATMRSAFWHRAVELPQLVRLSDGWGRMDLLPPSPAELAEIIRKPVEVAGLQFEVHPATGIGLDARIAEDAASEPGVLPLVSFVLDTLYADAVTTHGGRVLTYGSYEIIGGLSGAIARSAEETVRSLPPSAQRALPRVLLAMTSTAEGAGDVPLARAASIDHFPPESESRRVVDALIGARLLIASNEGTAITVRPSHDAILTHWERARDLIAVNRRDLATRSLVERHSLRWLAANRISGLLLRDPDLANAVDLERRWGDELDPKLRTFIRISRRRAQRRRRLTIAAALVFGITSVVAVLLAIIAARQRGLVLEASIKATDARIMATQESIRAAEETIRAAEARDRASEELHKAVQAVRSASLANLRAASTISPDGKRLVSVDSEGRARVIDLGSGQDLGALDVNNAAITSVAFSPDGKRIVTAASNFDIEMWDAKSLSEIAILRGQTGPIRRVVFSPDGSLIASGGDDNSVRVWSTQSGEALYLTKTNGPVIAIAFSPDGTRLIVSAANGESYVIDAATGNLVHHIGAAP